MLKEIFDDCTFGEPWRLNDESLYAVVPIIRVPTGKRDYVLLQEIEDKVELVDTGSISQANIKNKSNKNVFIRKGTLLKGNTQERGVTVGRIILPNTQKELTIQCVHASKGIQAGAVYHMAEEVAPQEVMQCFMDGDNQGQTWEAVSRASHNLLHQSEAVRPSSTTSTSTSTHRSSTTYTTDYGNIVNVLETSAKFKDIVEKILKKIPAELKNQVGIVVVDTKGVSGLELFDHPDSWKAFSGKIIRSYADVFANEDKISSKLFEIKLDKVNMAIKEFIGKIISATNNVVYKEENTETYTIDGSEVVGEFTSLNDKAIHVIASRRKKEPKKPQPIFTGPNISGNRIEGETFSGIYMDSDSDMSYTGKGSTELLTTLHNGDSTWKDLEDKINISSKTLSKRIKEAQVHNYVDRGIRQNGRNVYHLTGTGQKALLLKKKKQE